MKTIDITKMIKAIEHNMNYYKSVLTEEQLKKSKRLNELYVIARNDEDVHVDIMCRKVAKLLEFDYKVGLEYVRDLNFLDILKEVQEENGTCTQIDGETDNWYYLQYDDTTYAVHYDVLDPYFDGDECCTKKFDL